VEATIKSVDSLTLSAIARSTLQNECTVFLVGILTDLLTELSEIDSYQGVVQVIYEAQILPSP